jgi:hypothetical protein
MNPPVLSHKVSARILVYTLSIFSILWVFRLSDFLIWVAVALLGAALGLRAIEIFRRS